LSLIFRYLRCPGEPKWHLMSLLAASFAVLSKETGITALGINILFGASKLFLQTSNSPKKVSNSSKIAAKRISTDAFIVSHSFENISLEKDPSYALRP